MGHKQIHQNNLRNQIANAQNGCRSLSHLTHDCKISLGFKQSTHPMSDNGVVIDNHPGNGFTHPITPVLATVSGGNRGRLTSMQVPAVLLAIIQVPASASIRSRILARPDPFLAVLRLRKPCPSSWIVMVICAVVQVRCSSTLFASLWRVTLASASWTTRNKASSRSSGVVRSPWI